MKKIRAWWFSAGRTLPHGDGREISVGATHKVKGLPVLCQYGLHGSRRIIDALTYAPGKLLWRTEHAGDVVEGDDKLVSTERRYLAVVDATEILRRFARLSALDVIDKWDAPEVVVRYLRTGDESIRIAAMTAAGTSTHIAGPPASARGSAAEDAAWAAVCAAQMDAVGAAECAHDAKYARVARDTAARDASQAAQNKRLHRMALEAIRRKK